jgi:signal transduction histidine kinase
MRATNPLRSGAFRFALLLAAVFAVGTAALMATVVHEVGRFATEVARDSVATEAALLEAEDRASGRAETIQSVVRRENAARDHQLRYLMTDRAGRYLAGSLPASAAHIGWRPVTIANDGVDEDSDAKTLVLDALGVRLSDGATLVVASDRSDLDQLRAGLVASAALFGGAVTLFVLIGGWLAGGRFLRRLNEVNRSVHRIVEGRIAERLPAIGMSGEFDDLSTNLNHMLDRIEALMEGMRQVSTDIAHDLRTPLTRLRQRLETLKETPPEDLTGAEIDGAIDETDRILAIFAALLRISSLEAGAGARRIAPVDLSEIVERVFEAYRPVAEDADHALSATIAPDVVIQGDADMLIQAATNLVENAVFHTPPGCRIALTLDRRPGHAVIAVADNGPGVPAAERDKVLGRFYRLEASRGVPGAGLGLALVAAVAAIHRADLRLTDNGPGLRVELILHDPRTC